VAISAPGALRWASGAGVERRIVAELVIAKGTIAVEHQADLAANHFRMLVEPIEQRRAQRLCDLIVVLEIARMADVPDERGTIARGHRGREQYRPGSHRFTGRSLQGRPRPS